MNVFLGGEEDNSRKPGGRHAKKLVVSLCVPWVCLRQTCNSFILLDVGVAGAHEESEFAAGPQRFGNNLAH